jgi:hypothetical protein
MHSNIAANTRILFPPEDEVLLPASITRDPNSRLIRFPKKSLEISLEIIDCQIEPDRLLAKARPHRDTACSDRDAANCPGDPNCYRRKLPNGK